ncbi:unnamed protein product, partial [Musa banksii]
GRIPPSARPRLLLRRIHPRASFEHSSRRPDRKASSSCSCELRAVSESGSCSTTRSAAHRGPHQKTLLFLPVLVFCVWFYLGIWITQFSLWWVECVHSLLFCHLRSQSCNSLPKCQKIKLYFFPWW